MWASLCLATRRIRAAVSCAISVGAGHFRRLLPAEPRSQRTARRTAAIRAAPLAEVLRALVRVLARVDRADAVGYFPRPERDLPRRRLLEADRGRTRVRVRRAVERGELVGKGERDAEAALVRTVQVGGGPATDFTLPAVLALALSIVVAVVARLLLSVPRAERIGQALLLLGRCDLGRQAREVRDLERDLDDSVRLVEPFGATGRQLPAIVEHDRVGADVGLEHPDLR